jgi:hypothetical protein
MPSDEPWANINDDPYASVGSLKSVASAISHGAAIYSEGLVSASGSASSLRSVTLDGSRTSHLLEPDVPRVGPSPRAELLVVIVMVLSGSLVNACGGMAYRLSPSWNATGTVEVINDGYLTFLLTVGVFVFCALGAALSRANRRALRARATYRFLTLLAVPSVLDTVITGLATLALAFTQPALVGILKTATQLVVLAVISRLVLSKRLSTGSWLCILAVLATVVGLAVYNVLDDSEACDDAGQLPGVSQQAIGVSLSVASGALGALRNLIEASILDDDSFPPSALLLAESAISAAILIPCGLLFYAICESHNGSSFDRAEDRSFASLKATVDDPVFLPVALFYLFAAYGKDAGKFWLIKYSSALRQKVLALLFPVGTWIIGIVVYYSSGFQHQPTLGVPWKGHGHSLIQLAGFAVIIVANGIFVMIKVPGSRVANCCSRLG